MELDYAVKPAMSRRINLRMIFVLGVLCVPFVWFFATFVQEARSGGIVNKGDYSAVDLKSLGNFPFDKTNGQATDIPERFRELDGKRVALEGFMYPLTSAGPSTARCQFVYNITKCCFSGPPQVQERVFLQAPGDTKLHMYDSQSLVRVYGKLHVGIKHNDMGEVISVYELTPDKIEQI